MTMTSTPANGVDEKIGQVLPFYVVADESGSMDGAPITAINAALPRLHAEVISNPVVTDKIRFSLMAFAGTTEVLLALADLKHVKDMPGLAPRDSTNYGSAFDTLRATIETDVAQLDADGYRVFRPAVFFLSDGQPTDKGWEAAYSRVIAPDWKLRPHILAFGFGEAEPGVIAKVATLKAYMADAGVDPAAALAEWATRLTQTMVLSGNAIASGTGTLVVPPTPTGFHEIPLETIN
jgi:uncharacterized protein YegL